MINQHKIVSNAETNLCITGILNNKKRKKIMGDICNDRVVYKCS